MYGSNYLFREHDLSAVLRGNLDRVKDTVDSISEKQFLNSNDEEIFEHVFSKLRVLPIDLNEDLMEMDNQETRIDVSQDRNRNILNRGRPFNISGLKITVSIPYTGNPDLWKCQPNSWKSIYPSAQIRINSHDNESGFVDLIFEKPADKVSSGSEIKSEIESKLSEIKWYLNNVNGQVNGHNKESAEKIKSCIENRRRRLGKFDDIAKTIGIPLKRKTGSPDFSKLPIKRRIIKPLSSKPNKPPEPGLDEREFEYILKIIRHEGRTFETTPNTYTIHDEEELRDILLAHLNGHYQGDATGETFRKFGRTDIRIEDKNRAAFVAECKVWRGPKELFESIDQLLGYLTWRDCKTTIIIFNKNVAGFTGIQNKISEIFNQHPKFISELKVDESGEWRFRFSSEDDPDRHIIAHIFLFNLYVKGGNEG